MTSAWTDTHELRIRDHESDSIWISWTVWERSADKPVGGGLSPRLECVFKDAREFGFILNFQDGTRSTNPVKSRMKLLTKVKELVFRSK